MVAYRNMSTVQSHTVVFYYHHFMPSFISRIIIFLLFVIFMTDMWIAWMYKSETWWISWILLPILDLTNMVPLVISKLPIVIYYHTKFHTRNTTLWIFMVDCVASYYIKFKVSTICDFGSHIDPHNCLSDLNEIQIIIYHIDPFYIDYLMVFHII